MNKARKILYISAAAIILSSLLIPIRSNITSAAALRYSDVFTDKVLAQAVAEAHQDAIPGYSGDVLGADSEIAGDLGDIYTLIVTENVGSLEGLEELENLEDLQLLGKKNTFTVFPDFNDGHFLFNAEISSHKLSSLSNLQVNGFLAISDVSSSLIEKNAPVKNNNIAGLNLKNTDIASFDFLSNFPALTELTVEDAPEVSDFSGLYSNNLNGFYVLSLKNVGTNVPSASLNIKDLFNGSLQAIMNLYLDGVRADFAGMTENAASETVSELTLNRMGLSDFSGISSFSEITVLTLKDNKFTSVEGLENIIEIPQGHGWPRYADVDFSNTEPKSSYNAIRDISPLENNPGLGSFKFVAENQYITENAISYSPEHKIKNVIKIGALELICSIKAPGNASYTVEYDPVTDIVKWENIPANATEISYEFSYETKDIHEPPLPQSAPETKDLFLPMAAADAQRDGILFNGTVTIPIKSVQVRSFEVIYHANNGDASPETMTDKRGPYTEGSAAEVLGNDTTGFKKDNHIFMGWNTDAAEASAGKANPAYDPGMEFAVPDHDTELYAVWKEDPSPVLSSDDLPEEQQDDPSGKSSSPKTGDSSSLMFSLLAMTAAAAVLTAAGKAVKQTGKQ